jgi:hypothetical protein
MTDFTPVTPFELARRLAVAGPGSPAVYLLILESSTADAVRSDIAAEIQVQLGMAPRSLIASEMRPEMLDDAFRRGLDSPVVLITFDRSVPKLIDSLDRNVVLLERSGIVLLLGRRELADRVLTGAPNLRSRITDVLAVNPDEAFGGAPV